MQGQCMSRNPEVVSDVRTCPILPWTILGTSIRISSIDKHLAVPPTAPLLHFVRLLTGH
jgi:hypothetical protein